MREHPVKTGTKLRQTLSKMEIGAIYLFSGIGRSLTLKNASTMVLEFYSSLSVKVNRDDKETSDGYAAPNNPLKRGASEPAFYRQLESTGVVYAPGQFGHRAS